MTEIKFIQFLYKDLIVQQSSSELHLLNSLSSLTFYWSFLLSHLSWIIPKLTQWQHSNTLWCLTPLCERKWNLFPKLFDNFKQWERILLGNEFQTVYNYWFISRKYFLILFDLQQIWGNRFKKKNISTTWIGFEIRQLFI